ncbi:MAG: hypothetical protein K2N36_03985, partial [Ruminiclostridium sp.]|nr:hypothetical protein [Ruminiclostridium sp.]
PVTALILLADDSVKELGFGIPLYLSVIIFLLTAVLGTLWTFYYNAHRYKKVDAKFASPIIKL